MCYNISEPQMRYAKLEKLDRQATFHMIPFTSHAGKGKAIWTEKRSDCQELRVWGLGLQELTTKGHRGTLGEGSLLHLYYADGYMIICICQNS